MDISDKIKHFAHLGNWINNWLAEYVINSYSNQENSDFASMIARQHSLNNWLNETDIIMLLSHYGKLLSENSLEHWLKEYSNSPMDGPAIPVYVKPNTNSCFAGFAEWLCCIAANNRILIKAENNQFQILRFLSKKLVSQSSYFNSLIEINESPTGKPGGYIVHVDKENITSQHYFKKHESLLIETLPSIALITGNESKEELNQLGTDIFLNLGQSSRTLRKLYVPAGYDFNPFFEAIESFSYVYQNNKYANNYDYYQSIFLMDRIPFLDNGFLVVKQDASLLVPTGCLYYEFYENLEEQIVKIKTLNNIENVICKDLLPNKTVKPGKSHFPNLKEYENRKDLLEFNIRLKI